MSIDTAAVRRIARLARIAIADAEVAPLAHPHEQALAWRADAVTEGDRADTFLALAPDARAGLYLVPKVIE